MVIGAAAVVSELRLTAAGVVTLSASEVELLRTSPGAPPLRLFGLTLRGPVRIDGSRAHFGGCTFEDVEAGTAAAAAAAQPPEDEFSV